jgi:amino acid transporter
MKRSISKFALLFTSVSAILGSGWLFTSYYTATLAGPAALVSWVLGGLMMIFIAFIFAELTTLLPITGSSTRVPQFTHGTLVSFLFSWIIWLSYAALVPTEVQAVIQYMSYFFPGIVNLDSSLTHEGYLVAAGLMLIISAINIFSLSWLLRCNNILTLMKLIIPITLAIIIISHFGSIKGVFHPAGSEFAPYGWHGILAAITTGGILFAFNGFKQACEMAGEAKRPSRALPFAVIGSITITLTIYLLLQVTLYVSLTPANYHGSWKHLLLPSSSSPLAAILHQDQLRGLLPLLYVGAIIGPLAAALMYAGSASRSIYGMSKSHHIPRLLSKLTAKGNPMYAIILNFCLGMLMFAPLPGWNKMIDFLTSLMAITYAIGPVALLALRSQLPNRERPFRLPFASLWATLAFYLCTLLAYWSGWAVMSKLGATLVMGLIVLLIHRLFIQPTHKEPLDWRASIWVWPYFSGLILFSYLGSFGHGRGIIPLGWDFLCIGLFCIAIMWLAMRFKLPSETTEKYVEELKLTKPHG